MKFKFELDWLFKNEKVELEILLEDDNIVFSLNDLDDFDDRQPINYQNYFNRLDSSDFPIGTSMTTYYNLICDSFTLNRYKIETGVDTSFFKILISLHHDLCKKIKVTMFAQVGAMFHDAASDIRDLEAKAGELEERIETLENQNKELIERILKLEQQSQNNHEIEEC